MWATYVIKYCTKTFGVVNMSIKPGTKIRTSHLVERRIERKSQRQMSVGVFFLNVV